jgi:hypothetical protein
MGLERWYCPEGNEPWATRHNMALNSPRNMEYPIVKLLDALDSYILFHREKYDSDIFEDGVLGKGVVQIVTGIRTLLNGECGRLDCGTIDGHLHDLLDIAGPDLD